MNKLYNQLTPYEQASLVFEAVIRRDNSEADLVLDSIQEKTFTMPDIEYQQRIQGLTNLSSAYGIDYWQTLCQLSDLVGIFSKDDSLDELIQRFINKLFSINVALEIMCKKLGVDTSTIKQFAKCSDFDPKFGGEADDQIVGHYAMFFSQVSYLETASET